MQHDVFQAIADPTRRAIIDLLAGQSMPVNRVAANFDMSRPAVSKHLKILRECGLISVRKEGRKHLCRAKPGRLREVARWTNRYQKFWNHRLDDLEQALNQDTKTTKQ